MMKYKATKLFADVRGMTIPKLDMKIFRALQAGQTVDDDAKLDNDALSNMLDRGLIEQIPVPLAKSKKKETN